MPPLVHRLGPLREVSWARTIVPEIVWIALIQYQCGHQRGVELVTSLARTVRSITGDQTTKLLAAASTYLDLSEHDKQRIAEAFRTRDEFAPLCDALRPLIDWYPKFPLSFLFAAGPAAPDQKELERMKDVLRSLRRRGDRDPMLVQATVVWLMFDAGKLKVFDGLALAKFPEIERYPNTKLSQEVGSAIRASVTMFFGSEHEYSTASPWPNQFWNHGLVIEPCQFRGDSDG